MNLSGTGLSSQVIYDMGTALRRARSILVIHLSGNPGLTPSNMEYLSKRIRCRPNEDIERFTRIQAVVKGVLRSVGANSNIITGIKVKVERDSDFNQVHKKDPIEFSVNDQLVFQRMLGHRVEQPGSGQWYESSKNAVAYKPHYKNECWICEGHIFSVIFWSKGMCYKLKPILSREKTIEIMFEVDRNFEGQDASDNMYTDASVKYSALENQVPMLCGSFTGWRYKKMIPLEEFNRQFETAPRPFDVAVSMGHIRPRISNLAQCNLKEKRHVEIAELEEKLRYMYGWRTFFAANMRFKRPFLVNSHFFEERPSANGTLPEDDDIEIMGEILSDETSDDESQEAQTKPLVQKVEVKLSQMSREEQEKWRKD